jgi:hypothetical protein
MKQQLLDALRSLGPGTDKAGEFGVLRVVASIGEIDREAIARLVEEDKSGHPVATIDLKALAWSQSQEDILESLKNGVALAAENRIQGEKLW